MNATVLNTIDAIYNDITVMLNDVDRMYYHTLYGEIKKNMGPDCAYIFSNNVHSENGTFWFENIDEIDKVWNRMIKNKS